MAEAFTLYKLIILYMLDKVDFPLTNSQISEFVLDKGYTDYFKLQQALSELADGGLILKESTHNRTLFHLTEDGKGTIHLFRDKISKPRIDDLIFFLPVECNCRRFFFSRYRKGQIDQGFVMDVNDTVRKLRL